MTESSSPLRTIAGHVMRIVVLGVLFGVVLFGAYLALALIGL